MAPSGVTQSSPGVSYAWPYSDSALMISSDGLLGTADDPAPAPAPVPAPVAPPCACWASAMAASRRCRLRTRGLRWQRADVPRSQMAEKPQCADEWLEIHEGASETVALLADIYTFCSVLFGRSFWLQPPQRIAGERGYQDNDEEEQHRLELGQVQRHGSQQPFRLRGSVRGES